MLDPIKQMKIEKAIRRAPMLSPSTLKVLELTSGPDPDLDEIIHIVRHDAPLTARLLRVVNSAAFGLLKEVTSVERAVTYLGIRTVVSTALATNLSALYDKPLEGYESEKGSLWDHSLFCALASRAIAQRARGELSADTAFTAGLLHDIGKAVISELLQGSTKNILDQLDEGAVEDYLSAERSLVGMDHAQVGQLLAKTWKIPPSLQEPILHHHRPGRAAEAQQPLTHAVHLGDILAMMGGQGTGSDSMQYRLDPGYSEYFAIDEDDLARILLEVTDEFQKLKTSLENL
ncbi:phosphohydrolase [Desulfuromonas versatilis]|uniref:Phosphohydrolase n=1 Tax=Desulfuromonas versatilis TaxID=2802975 RepID=A0ABM8I1V4_9BACT|nr:HDOD domain-containing protein [Desulfuromonas versatilis]BCR06649.1 phosphohydrolase [Desulfuromonas versatilis]